MNQNHSKHLELEHAKRAKQAAATIVVTEGVLCSFCLGMTILAMREQNYIGATLCAIPTSVGAIGAISCFNLFRDLKQDIEELKQEQRAQKAK